MKYLFILLVFLLNHSATAQELIVIGTLQDGGSPHMNCKRDCCAKPKKNDFVASIAVCDSTLSVVIDATPDFVEQTNYLREQFGHNNMAIFLTHAHVGHYSGLIHLGREAANTHKVPVYAMNRMFKFLSNNGPWDQLIQLENIELRNLQESLPVTLENGIVMTPVLVPHRDEYSETVGYYIKGQSKTALYIPDMINGQLGSKIYSLLSLQWTMHLLTALSMKTVKCPVQWLKYHTLSFPKVFNY